ncbi:MAG: MFS transporter [Bacteroidetes bacterium]|jgi:GPH family glycoside/pentoside/hexuronide:cation symporter|nr:MFS transporter [Bacteroidota bacterium]
MSNSPTVKARVPFGQKVAFGMGMLANQMFPAVLGIFMVVLVQDLGFPGWMWGVLFFLPRVFDSITDPIMGYISDNTRSVWGRRRQYVFLGAIIMGISFVMMWQLYRDNPLNYNFIYFLLWSFVFYLGLTIFSVPYVAMGYEMSDDFHERTNIMAVSQWIGQWAWVIAPWFWVIMYDQDWFPNADSAARTLSIYVGIGCAAVAMIPAIFIKTPSTAEDDSLEDLSLRGVKRSFKNIIDGFKQAFSSVPFRKLCLATFFIFNAFNTVASFTFFIVVYYLFSGDADAAGVWPTLFGSLGALVTTIFVIPTVAWLSGKLGKKRAFLVSQMISVFGYILLWFLFVPGKPYLFIFALPFFSFGIGSLFTLMMSMTADVCDLDELKHGRRREGIFGAIYWWMVKFGFAIAGLMSGLILSLIGFEAAAATQDESTITGLRLFFSGVPIAGTLLALYVMRDYDLTEDRANEIRAALDSRKGTTPSGYSGPSILSGYSLKGFSKEEILQRYPGFLPTSVDFNPLALKELRKRFYNELEGGMKGICFSVYREDQEPGDYIKESQIRRRLEILKNHTEWVRIFSCTDGHEKIPQIAKEYGLKTLVGAWISNDIDRNRKELNSLAQLINDGLVDIAAIGNEVLYRNELSESIIIQYLNEVRSQANGTPIAYVDIYHQFINRPNLVEHCDIILANCYPYWEGADIDYAGLYLQEMHRKTVEYAQGKPVVIAETGWPSVGQKVDYAEPSAENAMKYFLKTQEWAKNKNVDLFYFSSFDESWKVHAEGWAGTSWGLWNKDEKLKY